MLRHTQKMGSSEMRCVRVRSLACNMASSPAPARLDHYAAAIAQAELLLWLNRSGAVGQASALNSDGMKQTWDQAADSAFTGAMKSTGNSYAFMELSLNNEVLGRVCCEFEHRTISSQRRSTNRALASCFASSCSSYSDR